MSRETTAHADRTDREAQRKADHMNRAQAERAVNAQVADVLRESRVRPQPTKATRLSLRDTDRDRRSLNARYQTVQSVGLWSDADAFRIARHLSPERDLTTARATLRGKLKGMRPADPAPVVRSRILDTIAPRSYDGAASAPTAADRLARASASATSWLDKE